MIGLLCFFLAVLASPFKSQLRLEAENAVLRHQLNPLRRKLHGRVRLTNHDRLFFIQLYRWFPSILKVLTIIRPETLVRWHRAGFRCYWRRKSHKGRFRNLWKVSSISTGGAATKTTFAHRSDVAAMMVVAPVCMKGEHEARRSGWAILKWKCKNGASENWIGSVLVGPTRPSGSA
jgi:hypothetical protein